MATITPVQVFVHREFIEGGQVVQYIELTFDVEVRLSGIPQIQRFDGGGSVQFPRAAGPHISPPATAVDYIELRYADYPDFETDHLVIPVDDPHVTGPGGEFMTAGSYDVGPRV